MPLLHVVHSERIKKDRNFVRGSHLYVATYQAISDITPSLYFILYSVLGCIHIDPAVGVKLARLYPLTSVPSRKGLSNTIKGRLTYLNVDLLKCSRPRSANSVCVYLGFTCKLRGKRNASTLSFTLLYKIVFIH